MDRLTHERNSGIKTGYWSPAKKEELVQHLAAYERTGLTPEQIREMDQLYLDKCREVTELRKKLEWIPVTERLPKDNINPVTQDAYVYPVTISSGNVRDVRFYSFYNGHWYNFGPHPLDDIVVAWLPRPDPYRPED